MDRLWLTGITLLLVGDECAHSAMAAGLTDMSPTAQTDASISIDDASSTDTLLTHQLFTSSLSVATTEKRCDADGELFSVGVVVGGTVGGFLFGVLLTAAVTCIVQRKRSRRDAEVPTAITSRSVQPTAETRIYSSCGTTGRPELSTRDRLYTLPRPDNPNDILPVATITRAATNHQTPLGADEHAYLPMTGDAPYENTRDSVSSTGGQLYESVDTPEKTHRDDIYQNI